MLDRGLIRGIALMVCALPAHGQLRRANTPHRSPQATRACLAKDWAILNRAQTRALLSSYGYGEDLPWTCEALDVSWLATAKIVRLHAVIQLDDYRDLTLLQASPTSRIWLIPTCFGMICFPQIERDPHNLAAFNDLLRLGSGRPVDSLLFELADLYQAILHMDQWFDPDTPQRSIADAVQVSDIQGTVTHDAHGVTLTHREQYGDSMRHEYMIWEFYFESWNAGMRLSSVRRKTLDEYNEEN